MTTPVRQGRFVTLEGIEGVGKTTNLAFVADFLRGTGKEVVSTREPGGVPVAERIRKLLLSAEEPPPGAMSELLLMFAARAAHLEELIYPALARGAWVVCDRFTDASYAYQSGGRGLPASVVRTLETLVQGAFQPDLTILLDSDWHRTRARRAQRGASDRFEAEDAAFFERVRASYLDRARAEPDRIRVVDAAAPLHDVQLRLAEILKDCIAENTSRKQH
jgi:dTMP kinase